MKPFRTKCGDSSGRFLHAWWIAILGIFSLTAERRAVYLLPLHPAIALLSGRVLATAIAKAQGAQGLSSLRKIRSISSGSVIAVFIVIFDLAHAATPSIVREHRREQKSQVSFAKKIKESVPRSLPLFAGSNFPETDLMVISYRLDRPIGKGPKTCAGRDFYFLSVITHGSHPVSWKVLASLEKPQGSLALMFIPKEMSCAG